MASASGYNHQRFARAILKRSRKWEPSLTVQLYASHWRFENSPLTFQYNGPMQPFLLALRAQVIPAILIPWLSDIKPPVAFVDGCLVVEIQDFRKTPEVRSRVVMRPAPEAMAQAIDSMMESRGRGGDEDMALELESRIIAATAPPLYLGTSIIGLRNATLATALTAPAGPHLAADGSFRHATQSTGDERSSVERMHKLLRAGAPDRSGAFQPNWSILRLKQRMEDLERQSARDRDNRARPGSGPHAEIAAGLVDSITNGEPERKPKKKKRPKEDDVGDRDKSLKKKQSGRDGEDVKVQHAAPSKPKKKSAKQKREEKEAAEAAAQAQGLI